MITIYDQSGKPLLVHEVDARELITGGFFFRDPVELKRARVAAPSQETSESGLDEKEAKPRLRRTGKGREAGSWL